jgi:hypothetical protein
VAKRANVYGGSKDPNRGTWCTPKRWAEYVGPFDVDPFSNPRSHIVSSARCMLERGDNGFGSEPEERRVPGRYFTTEHGNCSADENTRVFLQPPYEIVDQVVGHYGHTRFTALLRFDPPVGWFKKLYRLSELVCVISDKRLNFEPPPGLGPKGNNAQPFPHALFYRRAEDATRDVLRRCISWRPRP